jgi:hypothetical protein
MKIPEITKLLKDISRDMPNMQYHMEKEHKSSSGFSKLLFNRPDHFFKNAYADFMLIVFDEGSLFHTMLGEPDEFENEYSTTDTPKWVFKGAGMPSVNPEFMKERKIQARYKKTLVTNADVEKMTKKVSQCYAKPKLKRLLEHKLPERSFFGEIDGFKVKVRPDLICFDTDEDGEVTRVRIIDIKTSSKLTSTMNASLSCFTYGYHIALYMYQKVVQDLLIEAGCNLPVTFDYLFVCRQKSNHKNGLFKSTEHMYELGKSDFERTLNDFRMIESGDFGILEEEGTNE